MPRQPSFLAAGQAARQLGVSPKALRLYEDHGLITPGRTRAGWRAYGPTDMEAAREIIALRKLDLGLAAIAVVLKADPSSRDAALASHRSRLEAQVRKLGAALHEIGAARADRALRASADFRSAAISFALPWPWGGEDFLLPPLPPLTFITGPLGSGKTRLAMRLASALPDCHFLGLERLDPMGRPYATMMDDDVDLAGRCNLVLNALERDGATPSMALTTLVAAICSAETPLVIDMIEQGLDHPTQIALARHLRQRSQPARPLISMTRSSAILDLSLTESGETIIYCPANHSPPMLVHPDPLCAGYEAVATCLATPEVRARTAGVVAAWAAAP